MVRGRGARKSSRWPWVVLPIPALNDSRVLNSQVIDHGWLNACIIWLFELKQYSGKVYVKTIQYYNLSIREYILSFENGLFLLVKREVGGAYYKVSSLHQP